MEVINLTPSRYTKLMKLGDYFEKADEYQPLKMIDNFILVVKKAEFDLFEIEQDQMAMTKSDDDDDLPFTIEPSKPKEVVEAENTILNTDPFGYGLSGKTLKEIVENAPEWCQICLKRMTNKYIRDRVELLMRYYNK